jgi:ABC-type bacteriocin/lantibiotic exporter with double-glycine peptidase domain
VAEALRKILRVIDPSDYLKAVLLACVMLLAAITQSTGIVSIVPFLAVLSEPQMVESNAQLKQLYEALGFENRDDFLFFLGVVAFTVFASGTALQAVNFWLTTRFANRQQYKLSRRLMSDYLRRPYAFFLTRNSSDLAKTVLQETMSSVSGVLLPAMNLLSQVFVALMLTMVLVLANPVLALSVAVTIGGIYGLIFYLSRRWLTSIGEDTVRANAERFRAASDCFAGAKEVRLLGRERAYLEQYRVPSQRWAGMQANSKLIANTPVYAMEAIAFGGVMLVILWMMRESGDLASILPMLGLYGLAGRQLIPAFNKIFAALSECRYNFPALEKVIEDLDEVGATPSALPNPDEITPLRLARDITAEGLSYRYEGAARPALDRVDFCIPALSSVGIVGASGAGKSTLIDVLLGLLQPGGGRLTVDGQVLEGDVVHQWQANVGYVPQHIFLADRSVAENVALGIAVSEIDRSRLESAARMANLHDFVVNELLDGYDTLIGDRGVRLSGGQRQRIGIARALYREPDVLVFDEATSALDNATEQSVMQAIDNLAGSKTIIIVAHRLSTVRRCDQIIVLGEGKVVEAGSWAALSASGGAFQRLVSSAGS